MKLLGLSGSLRKEAHNRYLLREAARLAGAEVYVEADLDLPLFNEDLEAGGTPSAVARLADQIGAADAVLMSTPEYNKGMSGVLKNALDWISRIKGRPLSGKPVAIMSSAAGRSGGERAQAMLRQSLVAFNPRLALGPEIHIAGHFREFDEEHHLTNERYRHDITRLMDALKQEVAHATA